MTTVSGTATDNVEIARVDVQVDGGPLKRATGTTSWTTSLDMTPYGAGGHTVSASATDTSGHSSVSTKLVTVASDAIGGDIPIVDPGASYELALLGRGKMATTGSLTGLLYWERFTSRRVLFLRDVSTGATSFVDLPVDVYAGWSDAKYVLAGPTDLWILGGNGPVYLRHYTLSGAPLPASAALASTQMFGDSDSRTGDLTMLASGGLVAVWNQQGETGSIGMGVAYRSPKGTWQTLDPLQFMPTASSKQVLAQHPADGTIWLFNNPDGWGQIGAAHLTEGSSGLSVDWTDAHYIMNQNYGDFAPDPENPDLAVAPDPSTGTLVLAYQSAVRQMFSTSPVITGSHVSVARIGPAGPTSFVALPVYVERVSTIGLVVRSGETWLSYRAIDPTTLTFDRLYARAFRNGSWSDPIVLGTLADRYGLLTYGTGRPEFAAPMADGRIHLFVLS